MTAKVICVDANFVVRLIILSMPESPFIVLWERWQDAGYKKVAPTLFYYEISNAIHRYVIAGQLLPEQAEQALSDALNLDISLYGDAILHRSALNLARSLKLPAAYDAHYLALAEQLEAEFWTADRRLFQAVQTTLPWVHLVT